MCLSTKPGKAKRLGPPCSPVGPREHVGGAEERVRGLSRAAVASSSMGYIARSDQSRNDERHIAFSAWVLGASDSPMPPRSD